MAILAFFAAFTLASGAFASIGSDLGFTSRATALGGAMVAAGSDSASAYQNPGSLAERGNHSIGPQHLQVHWSLIFLSPEFEPITGVIVESPYTSDRNPGDTRTGDVDTSYPNTLGQSIGLTYQSATDLHWSFGVVSFIPIQNLALVDSGETFIPEYTLHRAANQRPVFDLAMGIRPTANWSIGAGIHLGSSVNANATAFLQTDATKVSTMRLTAGVKTKASPFFGTEIKVMPGWILGLVARVPLAQRQTMKVTAAGQVLDGGGAPNFNYEANSVMFYDPLSIELGTSLRFTTAQQLFLQADYQAWSKYESPNIEINPISGSISIARSRTPNYALRDIWVPRVGYEFKPSDEWAIRAGYSYRPSIYEASPTDAGNALDPAQHRFSFGLGRSFPKFLDFDTPCRVDLHASYQSLVSERIVKAPGDETGAGTGNQKIGAPGYTAGGYLWGGGLSLAVML